jgi:DNA-binding FrmR family transcriptional regulator
MPTHSCCGHHKALAHPDHKKELSRLNRAIGQMEGVKKMIGERRYCVEILHQLKAIRAAIRATETNILKKHLESCVSDSFNDKKERAKKIDEIKELLEKFQT